MPLSPPEAPPPQQASLVPAVSCKTTARRAALAQIISVLNVEWIREHLLGIEAVTEAAILASPLQQLHAVTYVSDEIHAAVDGRDREAEVVASATNMMVPAFSCNGFNAGCVIEDVTGHWDPNNKCMEPGYRLHRFIVNEGTGFLVGASSPAGNRISLFSMDQIGTRYNVCQAYVFNLAQLRNLIGHTSNLPAFENALEVSMVFSQTRDCPVCGATGAFQCACPMQYHTSKNSLDFTCFTANLASRLGSYEGFGTREEFLNGNSIKTSQLGISWSGVRIARPGSSKRLLTWAIANSLSSSTRQIDRCLPRPLLEETKHATPTDDDLACLNVPVASDMRPDFGAVDLSMGSFDFGDIQLPKPIAKHDETSTVTADELIRPWESISPLAQEAEHFAPPFSHPSEAVVPTCIPGPKQGFLMSDVDRSDVPRSPGSSSKAVPIAPLFVQNSEADAAVQAEKEKRKNALELKQLRAYQRKIRNRESAARSNLARKKRKEMQRLELAKKQRGGQGSIGSAVS